MATGLLDYFPDALAAVANCSWVGNEQHNKGEPMHWAREKSTDHADCIIRHMTQRGTVDSDGVPHSAKVAWRALAMLQLEMERQANKAAHAEFQQELAADWANAWDGTFRVGDEGVTRGGQHYVVDGLSLATGSDDVVSAIIAHDRTFFLWPDGRWSKDVESPNDLMPPTKRGPDLKQQAVDQWRDLELDAQAPQVPVAGPAVRGVDRG